MFLIKDSADALKPRFQSLLRSVLFLALLAVSAATAPAAHAAHTVANRARAVAANLQPQGRLNSAQHLHLAISLPLRNQPALADFLRQLQDPASPNYHKYLTPAQFAERFGPTQADYNALAAFATAHGFFVVGRHPNRLILDVDAPVGKIEKAFHFNMRTYRHPRDGRVFYAPDANPTLDTDLPVQGISGLDNYEPPTPRVHPGALTPIGAVAKASPYLLAASGSQASAVPNTGSGPGGTYMGNDFRAAYAPGTSLTGTGQKIGLLEFDGYSVGDITYYESLAGLPNVPISNVLLDGFDGSLNGNQGEVSLDIEVAISLAPGTAGVLVYEAGPNGDWHDILNRMADDDLANQLSCSWYIPNGPADPMADQIFQQMSAQGQSFFSASGDFDAYTGLIPFPGDSPYITQVGGTMLTLGGAGGPWSGETVWNRNNGIGSGGGVSTQYAIPAWQQGINLGPGMASTTMRNTPDVAAVAEQVYVRVDGVDSSFGGTSCAAPLWAAFTALVNQQAHADAMQPIGFVNPAIYAICSGTGYTAAFHDVVTGNNFNKSSPANFSAATGYDLCTGWGSPTGPALINALAGQPTPSVTATGQLPNGVVGTAYSAAISGTGGAAPYTWSISAGNLAAGLGISSSTGVISGAPTLAGTSQFTVELTDANGTSTFSAFSISIYSSGTPIISTSSPLASGTMGVAYAQTFSASGGLTPYSWALASGTLPQGLALSSSGLLSGTPAITGTYNFSVQVTGSDAKSSVSPFVLLIPSAPVINSPLIASGTNGSYFGYQITATNSPTSFQAQGLPSGIGINPAFGFISGTFQSAGTFNVTITASNQWGASSAALVINVAQMPAPTIAIPFTSLVSFSGSNGANPVPGLIQASDGNLYGTTFSGGSAGAGTVFKMTVSGSLSTLASIDATIGSNVYSGVIQGLDGNFYGTAEYGPAGAAGVIYEVTSSGSISALLPFSNSLPQRYPIGGLIQSADGSFYGTSSLGGDDGGGSVFKYTKGGPISTIASFDYGNGYEPLGSVIQANDGTLYGTTIYGGDFGDGVVFRINQDGSLTDVVSFNGTNGLGPLLGVIEGRDGNFYGTTNAGGTSGDGTIFKATASGSLTTLYTFSGPDGSMPVANLMQAADGNFYGTTYGGGSTGNGTIFMITSSGSLATLVNFNASNGANPQGALIQLDNGAFYGTTTGGGDSGQGTVFTFSQFFLHAVKGLPFSYQIQAISVVPPSSYAASSLPPGLNLDTATGLISGTPTALGTNAFTISATNPGGTGSASMTITVDSGAPAITSFLNVTGYQGQPFNYRIQGSYFPTGFQAGGLPASLTLNSSTGVISGTITTTGTLVATIGAINVSGTGTATLTIAIVPSPPVFGNLGTVSGTVGQPLSYQLPVSYATGYSATGMPAGLAINASTGLISGTPTLQGMFSPSITATGAGGSTTQALQLNIYTTFAGWQSQWFTPAQRSNASISGAAASPTGDGVPNLLKYASNLGPTANVAAAQPVRTIVTTGSGTYLGMIYTFNQFATDLTYAPQLSTDLQAWHSGAGFISVSGTTANGQTESITVHASTPITSGSQQFIRLLVTSP